MLVSDQRETKPRAVVEVVSECWMARATAGGLYKVYSRSHSASPYICTYTPGSNKIITRYNYYNIFRFCIH